MSSTSNSTTTGSAARATKPIKLKAACNACHDAKVRCTGERSGCLRCQNLDHACIYAESRVGKVQGVRNRNKRALSLSVRRNTLPPESQQQPSSGALPCTMAQEEHKLQLASPVSLFWSESDDTYMNWPSLDVDAQTTALFAEDAAKGPYEFSPHMSTTCLTTPNSNAGTTLTSISSFSDMAPSGLDTLMPLSDIQSLSWPVKPEQSSTPHLPHPELPSMHPPEMEGPFLLTSLRTIDHLERNVLTRLSALDEILSLNRRTIANIAAFTNTPPPHSTSCIIVSAVLLHLVVALFESGCSAFQQEGALVGEGVPQLGMGGFTLDAEEQRVWGRRVVAKELRRCGGVVQRLVEVMGGSGKAGGVYEVCFRDLEVRLEALILLVEV